MEGKYRSRRQYIAKRISRGILRKLIAPLVSWKPLTSPAPGYTIILGCVGELAHMIAGNVACLARQKLDDLREIIIVLDRPRQEMVVDIEPIIRSRFPHLPCRFLYYNARQRFMSRLINWGWLNAWLSWCIGLAACRTRHAMLHDFDALLLDRRFIEDRFAAARELDCAFLGVRYYCGNGVLAEDRLAVTFELVLDVTVVRRFVQPIDLFNHVTIHRGRSVDFDTLLYTQSKLGSVMIRPIDDEAMAHPSQLICHYIAHTGGRGSLPPQWNSLLLIPYYFHLGGNPALMRATTQHLLASADGSIPLFGKPFNVAALSAEHVRWISELTHRVETAIVGHIQPEVAEYLAAMATAHGAGHRARVEPTSMETVEQ